MRWLEWLSVGGVVLFLGAVSTQTIHKIDHRLIALSVICGYLVLGALRKEQLKADIDWSALILLGILIGLIATIVDVNLHTLVADHLVAFSDMMKYHQLTFIAILAATVWVAGFWVPLPGALVALAAVPLAIVNGLNSWIVIFVCLIMNDCWLFPYQSNPYQVFRGMLRAHTSYDEKLFLQVNAGALAVRVLALIVSVGFWQYLRML
jgi:di/tricarboxylate transporter